MKSDGNTSESGVNRTGGVGGANWFGIGKKFREKGEETQKKARLSSWREEPGRE